LAVFPELTGQPARPEGGRSTASSGKILVVGLGNPGIEYQFTPHNAGFLAIDRIAEQHRVAVANRRCRALTANVRIASKDVILAKPETFMNLSGVAVQALVKEFEVDPLQELIVLYDEIVFPLGTLRIRERGSSGGHNGVKSISGALRSEDWLRIRIGVAPELPAAAESARRQRKDYVLTPFRKAELALLDSGLERAAKAVEMILASGVSAAMNEFNRREPNSSTE
jgi:PTH1 family peptidyl-tRNA hydrolase